MQVRIIHRGEPIAANLELTECERLRLGGSIGTALTQALVDPNIGTRKT